MARKNYPLRISPELYAALERWAADDLRSVNAQIEYLLTQSVKKAGRLGQALGKEGASSSDSEDSKQ
ncbi:PTS ascorbate transporter subunit IIC [Deinococcus oregonensis]|uniref:PTS ascorbate transporter subunit IIC n=1 Tax=Deinococcus oregonensis TaxID=1805970 RepID=A0ABV6B4H3_9DEIO